MQRRNYERRFKRSNNRERTHFILSLLFMSSTQREQLIHFLLLSFLSSHFEIKQRPTNKRPNKLKNKNKMRFCQERQNFLGKWKEGRGRKSNDNSNPQRDWLLLYWLGKRKFAVDEEARRRKDYRSRQSLSGLGLYSLPTYIYILTDSMKRIKLFSSLLNFPARPTKQKAR